MPDTVFDCWYHAPTYFRDEKGWYDPVGTCTLLVRRITVKHYDSGAVRVFTKRDAESFADEEAMVEAISERDMREIGEDEWRDPSYLPPEAEAARDFWKEPATPT